MNRISRAALWCALVCLAHGDDEGLRRRVPGPGDHCPGLQPRRNRHLRPGSSLLNAVLVAAGSGPVTLTIHVMDAGK